ncbi:MAG: hypothetical protein WA610_10725 [Thermodesulfovibrionales bacterium]
MASKIDATAITQVMIKAATVALKKKWPAARRYVEHEFEKFVLQMRHIEKLKDARTITEDEARFLARLQQNAMKTVLLTLEGLGMLAVESAVNASIDAVRDLINTAIGWKVL